ncbi:hypothetical protein F4805DRAFT_3101 [Annulohypoxylon moriforme]|nr:hypothetical protein F4805DRAFT_3101 [Annulohypoxylon moriforme]
MRHYQSSLPDISISNGTCYYDEDSKILKDYIPCGNVATGRNWTCCAAGDICLSNSACYHRHFDITYLSGCTDSSYQDSSCPYKGVYYDRVWVGLVHCEYDTDRWAGCDELNDDVPSSKPSACSCSEANEIISDGPVFDNIAQLPTSSGGSISWYTGMKPSYGTTIAPPSTHSATTTVTSPLDKPSNVANPISGGPQPSTIVWNPEETSSSPVQVSTTPSTVIPPSNQPDQSAGTPTGTNLSTAAQAGIGVGAGVGAILLGGLLYLVFFLRKRQGILRDNAKAQSDLPGGPTDPTSPAYTELAADELKRASELPGSPAASELPSPTAPQRSFRAYNPHLHGNYAQKSPGDQTRIDEEKTLGAEGESLVSPTSPLSPTSPNKAEKGSPGVPENENGDAKKGPTEPVYELEG